MSAKIPCVLGRFFNVSVLVAIENFGIVLFETVNYSMPVYIKNQYISTIVPSTLLNNQLIEHPG